MTVFLHLRKLQGMSRLCTCDQCCNSANIYTSCSGTEQDSSKRKVGGEGVEGGGGGDAADTVSVSSVMTTQSTDDALPSGRQALHKAVLEIVYSLSSDVSLKKNSQGLNQ